MKKLPPVNPICRRERGGCGREVAIISEPFAHQFGDSTHAGERLVAVHVDELNGRSTSAFKRSRFNRLRAALEERCALAKTPEVKT